MVAVKERLSGSWLDPKCSPILGTKLKFRLLERLKGEKAVFLTLTYARREGETPEELFRRSGTEQHVRAFMRRLGKALGQNFTGRWICKVEFQQGGWVHWHLIVVGLSFILHRKLDSAWGHGHCYVQKCSGTLVKYFAKYIAKGGNQNVPGWIYGFPSRSVKVIRTSPGFWPKVDDREVTNGNTALPSDVREEIDGEPVEASTPGKKAKRKPSETGVPIGRRLEEGRGVVVRAPDENGKVRYRVFLVDLGAFLYELNERATCTGDDGRWLVYSGRMEVAEAAAAAARRHLGEGDPEPGAPGDAGPPAGLHLNVTNNPRMSRRQQIERRQQWERENSERGWTPGEGPPVVVEWWEELEVEQDCREADRVWSNRSAEDPDWIEVWKRGDTWIPHHVQVDLEERGLL